METVEEKENNNQQIGGEDHTTNAVKITTGAGVVVDPNWQAVKDAKKRKRENAIRQAVDDADLELEFAEELIKLGFTLLQAEQAIRDRSDPAYKVSPDGVYPPWVEWTLPWTGEVARYTKGQGKHVRMAQDIAGTDESRLGYALAAQSLRIGNRGVVMEDFEEMDEDDVLSILERKGNFKLGRKILHFWPIKELL
jgi:hypothetical protein